MLGSSVGSLVGSEVGSEVGSCVSPGSSGFELGTSVGSSVGSIVGIIIFLELLVAVGGWKYKDTFTSLSAINLNTDISNTHALGNVLYTDYIHLFQISGIILLVAMIGAITLTFVKRENVKRQSYFDQIKREKDSAVSLIEVESGKGVNFDD